MEITDGLIAPIFLILNNDLEIFLFSAPVDSYRILLFYKKHYCTPKWHEYRVNVPVVSYGVDSVRPLPKNKVFGERWKVVSGT